MFLDPIFIDLKNGFLTGYSYEYVTIYKKSSPTYLISSLQFKPLKCIGLIKVIDVSVPATIPLLGITIGSRLH